MISLLRTKCGSLSPIIPKLSHRIQPCLLCSSRVNVPSYTPLLDLVAIRQTEAKKSVLVQVAGPNSAADLASYCNEQFGNVDSLYYYKNNMSKNFTDFFIVEFESEDSVRKVLSSAHHSVDDSGQGPVPVYSPFLWLQGGKGTKNTNTCKVPVDLGLTSFDMSLDQIKGMIDLSEQMYQFWRLNNMTETSLRLRFLVCRQVELAISGMFPQAHVLPFGSAINGFGRSSSDQDMILLLDTQKPENVESRLVFQAKGAAFGGERAQVQRYCEEVANIIQSFLPGCQDVQKILNARVPLIKYCHQLAGLECDLTMSSSSGMHMSCLLHLWGDMDWRVRPLVATVRNWAKSKGLVKEVRPTHFYTNFTITMLVVCYLQQVHYMLPSLNTLANLSTSSDLYHCEDGVNVQFLHNVSGHKESLNKCYSSSISLLELLHGFFEFYAPYNFSTLALDPISGISRPKEKSWKNSSALDLINPLEPDLNVSFNVNRRAVELFQTKCEQDINKILTLKEAEKEGTCLKDGLFWLFDTKDRGPHRSKLVFPSVNDLYLKEEKEKELEKLFKVDHEKGTSQKHRNHNRQNVGVEDTRDSGINVHNLYKKKKISSNNDEMKANESERVQELKAKYLRPKDHAPFSYKF